MASNNINLGIFKIIGLLLLLAVSALLLPFGLVMVEPNEVAVEINKLAGKVNPSPLGVGYHFYNRWTTDMVVYKVSARSYPADTMGTEGTKNIIWNLKPTTGRMFRWT